MDGLHSYIYLYVQRSGATGGYIGATRKFFDHLSIGFVSILYKSLLQFYVSSFCIFKFYIEIFQFYNKNIFIDRKDLRIGFLS